MLEAVISLLIYICILALVVYLIFWVLESIGVPIPEMVKRIIWIIVALLAILYIVKTVLPHAGLKLGALVDCISYYA